MSDVQELVGLYTSTLQQKKIAERASGDYSRKDGVRIDLTFANDLPNGYFLYLEEKVGRNYTA